MSRHLASADRSSLMDRLRKRIVFCVTTSRLSLSIAILTALSTPSLVSAQGIERSIDSSTSTSGTNQPNGNYISPSGKFSLSAFGGAQIMLVSITAELQYLSGGVWTSFNPAQKLTATAPTMPTWSTNTWVQIQGGYAYRVRAVLKYQYKLNPNVAWTEESIENTDFQKTFP
ncbi:MAG: hypothetical protein L0215_09585 [Gemmataceae bacterium]|nr:hypothetical protein [Gemmataceae bacterium]